MSSVSAQKQGEIRARLERRQALLKAIRSFFEARDVLEVSTPYCVKAATTDPHIQSFSVCTGNDADFMRAGYLHTSPEHAMKRLLAQGSGDIYQIAKVFRAGESGHLHNPEFTMLEWYRVGETYNTLMDEVAWLVQSLFYTGSDREERCQQPFVKKNYQEVFEAHLHLNPHDCTQQDLINCAEKAELGLDSNSIATLTRSNLLDMLFGFVIQPQLIEPTFIYDYPQCQAMLSKLKMVSVPFGQKRQVACRFELFIEGVELANGFDELSDAIEQRQRFECDNRIRVSQGLPALALDDAFLDCLDKGFPQQCAGVSIGLDRLFMLIFNEKAIAC